MIKKVPPVETPSDDDIKARWAKVTDPKEALREILENETFLGYDSYYKDLRDALLAMADRCAS